VPTAHPAPQILIVDDDEGILLLMAEALATEGYEVATARSAAAAREALAGQTPALLLLDLKLPDGGGPTLVADLQRGASRPVPFVIVTGQGDEKAAVEVMKQGALDYVMKDTALIDFLPAVVKRALAAVARDEALLAAEKEHQRLEQEIVAVGEQERLSIGSDLHDNLGQQLTALELMCTALKEDAAGHPQLSQRLAEMGRMLREAIAQTRALARGLVPVGNDPDALQIGLAELAARINGLGRVRCVFESPAPVPVADRTVAGHLYRIAQEAVNNALKHARARQITVRLTNSRDALVLTISDDGVGLPKVANHRGLGLGVMQHRAKAIGAELTIAPRRGGGLSVTCRLPHPR
jgi:signal transduction histidine kinase